MQYLPEEVCTVHVFKLRVLFTRGGGAQTQLSHMK